MLPSYGNSGAGFSSQSNIDLMKNYDSPYATGFHSTPLYPTYENLQPPPPLPPQPPTIPQNNPINIKSELNDAINNNYEDHQRHSSPIGSDHSESTNSLKIDEPKIIDNADYLLNSVEYNDKLKQNADPIFHSAKIEQSSE